MDDIRSLRSYTRRLAWGAFLMTFLYLAIVGSHDSSFRASLQEYVQFLAANRGAFVCLAVMGLVVILASEK